MEHKNLRTKTKLFQMKLATPCLRHLFSALLFLSCFFYATSQSSNGECERVDGNGTVQYLGCKVGSESLQVLPIQATIDPPDSSCKDSSPFVYCQPGRPFISECAECNDLFPLEDIYDSEVASNPTWWQSKSWLDYPEPLAINLTLSLGHTYTLISDITISFIESLCPQKMVLEKSSDYGASWQEYQMYAEDCRTDFNMTAFPVGAVVENFDDVVCTQDYCTGANNPYVTFNFADRIGVAYQSGSYDNPLEVFEKSSNFMEYSRITDIRLQLLVPPTDGSEFTMDWVRLAQYYYAINNIDTFFTCECNYHSALCITDGNNEIICNCKHNTMGRNCEECLPLYNNRPWQPGSQLPMPEGTANECQKCDCNDHAESCLYDANMGRGICVDCQNNTAGASCEICRDGFFRNMSLPISSPDICILCNCEPLGVVDVNATCAQYGNAELGKEVGQCGCKENVVGRACDRCIDGYFGLMPDGVCQRCTCNTLGTVDGSSACDQVTGECFCKNSTFTASCGQCIDEYYQFPSDAESECLPCDCDPGSSTSLVCHKESGMCSCRPHITGQTCATVEANYFVPFADFISFDAYTAASSCVPYSDTNVYDFTGSGWVTCRASEYVLFNVTIPPIPTNTSEFLPVIRYSYNSIARWEVVDIVISVSGHLPPTKNTPECPFPIERTTIHSINNTEIMLDPGFSVAWIAENVDAVTLHSGCIYDVILAFGVMGAGSEDIDVDALVLLPKVDNFVAYQRASIVEELEFIQCLRSITALSEDVQPSCQAFGVSLMAELFDGALECDCDEAGSMFTAATCRPIGGECFCKPGVGGRRCDQCRPGFYDFGSTGCRACSCNETGSLSLACDFETGQCVCKDGVALSGEPNVGNLNFDLQCNSCLEDYYPLANGQGCTECNCSFEGALNQQCDVNGMCMCKDTIGGAKCDECQPGFYNFTSVGCTSCNCSIAGSVEGACDPIDGTCQCKANTEGTKCDRCSPGFFNLDSSNDVGCQACFCFGHTNICNTAPNFVEATITSDFTSGSTNGWTASIPTSVDINPANIRISHPPNLVNQYVYLMAPPLFLGFQLYSYNRDILYSMKLDTGVVDQSNAPYVRLTGGATNQAIIYMGSIEPTNGRKTLRATLHEVMWRFEVGMRNISATEFYDILADVQSLEIRASFGTGTVTTFYYVTMETAKQVSVIGFSDVVVSSIEQCECGESTLGLSCQQCSPETYRNNFSGNRYDACVPCECNGRGSTCDPDTGTCLDCRLGTIGTFCESCAENVLETRCERCIPNYYGFGTELFGGACSACDCNRIGTQFQTACDNLSGQCPCIGNYGGRQCDRCELNYYNFNAGCLKCDFCYDSILESYTSISSSTDFLLVYMNELNMTNSLSTSGVFSERYTASQNQLILLIASTNELEEEAKNFGSTLDQLNETMLEILQTIEAILLPTFVDATQNLSIAQQNVFNSQIDILNTTESLRAAYVTLSDGDLQGSIDSLNSLNTALIQWQVKMADTADTAANELAALQTQVDRMRTLTDDAHTTAQNALQLAQLAQAIHDNTTNRLAMILSDSLTTDALGKSVTNEAASILGRAEAAASTISSTISDLERKDFTPLQTRIDNVLLLAESSRASAVNLEAQVLTQETLYLPLEGRITAARVTTDALRSEADAFTNRITTLHMRSQSANQEALSAVDQSQQAFETAEDNLAVAQNFQTVSQEARINAFTAISKLPAINQQAVTAFTLASQQRVQISDISDAAQAGLQVATDAYNLIVAEEQPISILKSTSEQLTSDQNMLFLNAPESTANSIQNINTTRIQPAVQQCQSNTQAVTVLQSAAQQATEDAQQSTIATSSNQKSISDLFASLQHIDALDISALPDLQERLTLLGQGFTQAQYGDAVRLLKTALDEQSAWLEAANREAQEMRAQIDALQSFRVSN